MASAANKRPRGHFVVVGGPDGVGKTTVAQQLIDLYPGRARYFHFRPPIWTQLDPGPGIEGPPPRKNPDPGLLFLGWLRLMRSFFWFWAGYLARIRPALRDGQLIVADRWAYGYLVQPAALRYRGPRWLAAAAVRLLPRPSLVVNLHAPTDVIRARKAELSVVEIRQELEKWKRLPGRVEPFDGTEPPGDIAKRVLARLGVDRRHQMRDQLPTISVVTPSLNQAVFLEDTLLSVLDQAYPFLELIVIDGGSTDGSVDIIRRYENRIAHWVSEPDSGQTDALKKGLSVATGDVVCWLNADDLHEPWTLYEAARFFVDNPQARVVYGDATWISEDGTVLGSKREHAFNRFVWMYHYNYIPQPSTFWRRSLYEEVGGLDTSFHLAMDADLWARFHEVTDVHHVRSLWSRMRLHSDQRNRLLRDTSDLEDARIRARYLPSDAPWVRAVKRLAARALRIALKVSGGCYSLQDLSSRRRAAVGRA